MWCPRLKYCCGLTVVVVVVVVVVFIVAVAHWNAQHGIRGMEKNSGMLLDKCAPLSSLGTILRIPFLFLFPLWFSEHKKIFPNYKYQPKHSRFPKKKRETNTIQVSAILPIRYIHFKIHWACSQEVEKFCLEIMIPVHGNKAIGEAVKLGGNPAGFTHSTSWSIDQSINKSVDQQSFSKSHSHNGFIQRVISV